MIPRRNEFTFRFLCVNEDNLSKRRTRFLKNERLWLNDDPELPDEVVEEEMEPELEEA